MQVIHMRTFGGAEGCRPCDAGALLRDARQRLAHLIYIRIPAYIYIRISYIYVYQPTYIYTYTSIQVHTYTYIRVFGVQTVRRECFPP